MPTAIILTGGAPLEPARLLRAIAARLTNEDMAEEALQSFTCGLLHDAECGDLFRVTTFDEKLDPGLRDLFAGSAAVSEDASGLGLKVVAGHALAGHKSYEEIYRQANASAKEFRFEFLTPTIFHHGELDLPLPLSRPLFNGLYRRWKHSHPRLAIHEEVVDRAERHLSIAALQIESKALHEERTTKAGFVGSVTFRVAGSVPREILHEMNVLADFAFFASAGQRTHGGMGTVHRLT